MREIKFRAWDLVSSKIRSVAFIEFDTTGEIANIALHAGSKSTRTGYNNQIENRADGEDLALMQFTGLYSKSGAEIYEGDVIAKEETVMSDVGEDKPNYIDKHVVSNFKYADGSVGERRYGREIITVRWENDNCGFEPFSDSSGNCGHCGGGTSPERIEVIGNIYENPELLKP